MTTKDDQIKLLRDMLQELRDTTPITAQRKKIDSILAATSQPADLARCEITEADELANKLAMLIIKEFGWSYIGGVAGAGHSIPKPGLVKVKRVAQSILASLPSPPVREYSQWLAWPENQPKMYDKIRVSEPLLFMTDDALNGIYVRQGYYREDHNCFYQSGDPKTLRWHDVKAFYHYPLPPITDVEVEDKL